MNRRRLCSASRVALTLLALLLAGGCATSQSADSGPTAPTSQRPVPAPSPPAAPTSRPVTKGTRINDQLVFTSPTFSITLAPGWREVVPSDAGRLDMHQHVVGSMNDRARAEFERGFGASLARTSAMLTNGRGAVATVGVAENRSVRYRAGYEMTARERELFWREFSRRLIAAAPENNKPVLTMRSVDVKDYGDSPALVVVYTREDLLGTLVWTQVSFFSEDSTITLIHIATLANSTNGLADFNTMVRSFRFGT